MLDPKDVFRWLADAGVSFFAGVPDSLLKDFCAYVTDNAPAERHVITANEGSAVGLAMGHYLATGESALVYMQNSGLGNTVNPLTSLASAQVYGIPMLLMVGWRGQPGVRDEPQHKQMGAVSEAVLAAIEVPHEVLSEQPDEAQAQISRAVSRARDEQRPHALLVRKGSFSSYKIAPREARYALSREAAIEQLVASLPPGCAVISTTGKPSRELFEVRERRGQPHDSDLLTVGGMGHASQIALGAALARPQREVYCLDGDGAVLMHMGGLATIATLAPGNFRHVVLNNAAHDSVGGQPTVGFDVDLCAVARACGYRWTRCADSRETLAEALEQLHREAGPALLEVRICIGARGDLGRPSMSPQELKRRFGAYLQNGGEARSAATDAADGEATNRGD